MSRKRSSSSNKQQVRRHGLVVTTLTLVAIFASGLVYIKTQRDNRSVEVPAATEPAPPAAPRSTPRDTPPKYEFYAELPRRELVIERREPPPRQTQPAERPQPPVAEARPAPPPAAPAARPAPPPAAQPAPPPTASVAGSRYVVQAGAYTLYSQADRARAQLAMLGINARIEEGTSNGLPIFRIRVGPMSNAEADSLRQRLRSNNIESMALRVN